MDCIRQAQYNNNGYTNCSIFNGSSIFASVAYYLQFNI